MHGIGLYYFSKSVDNFEIQIEHKTCYFLVRDVVSLMSVNITK